MQFTVSALSPSLVLPCFILSQQYSSMQPNKGRYLKMKGGQKRTTCMTEGAAVAQWLRCCATNRKVAGSIPASVIGIFHQHIILPIALWPWGQLSL